MPTQIYKVTTYLKSNTNPRKWFNDTLWECLEDDEDILETKIEQIGAHLEDESEGRGHVPNDTV